MKETMAPIASAAQSKLRIDRYSPHCLIGTLEAVARYSHDIPGLGRLWLGHAMGFSKRGPKVALEEDGISLNLEFGRVPIIDADAVSARLERYFGLVVQHKGYRELDSLLQDLSTLIAAGEPVVSDLDCYYLRGWREYHSGYNQHSMILYGRDGDHFLASEQMLGFVRFPLQDLVDNFRYLVERKNKEFILVRVRRVSPGTKRVDREALVHDLGNTLRNLADRGGRNGIRALEEFAGALAAFKTEAAGHLVRPFYIPGIWTLSHEARHSIKFLTDLEQDLSEPGLPKMIKQMIGLLDELHERWLEVDVNIETGLRSGSPGSTWKAVDCIGKLVGAERRMAGLYGELLNILDGRPALKLSPQAAWNGN